MRFINGEVLKHGENGIVVYLGLNNVNKNEFKALEVAQNMIESVEAVGQYSNAVLKQANPKYFRSSNGAVTYYWEVKGVLDGASDLEDSNSSEAEEPISYRRYFKIWLKKGLNVYLLLNLGYRAIDNAPQLFLDETNTAGEN